MPISRIPNINTKKFIVSYAGKFFGDIIHAFNLDLFSDKGRAKTGKKIYPHTTQSYITGLKNIFAFTRANLFDGDAGERETKIWGVSDNKVIKVQQKEELFELDNSEDLGTVGEKSDILSVGDETEEDIETMPVSISSTSTTGTIIAQAEANVKVAQSFLAGGPFTEITFQAKKAGTPIDTLVVSIQEDSGGEPSGTDLASTTISPSDLTTSFVEQELDLDDFDNEVQFDVNKRYWTVFKRSGAESYVNYYVIQIVSATEESGDAYDMGVFKRYNGTDWQPLKLEDSGDNELPTANKAVDGEAAWTNPTNVYVHSDTYAHADPTGGQYMRHTWSGFGFAIPAGAIIKGIEVDVRDSKSSADYTGSIYINLTKNANDKVGTERTKILSTTVSTTTYGDDSDLWGTSWTPAEINAANFGVRLDTTVGLPFEFQFRCMFIEIKVYYYEEAEEAENYLDAIMSVGVNFEAAYERLYLTTDKDVIFLNGDNGTWQSLWRGILQKDELNDEYPVILKNLGAGGTLIIANDNKVHTAIATANTSTEADENRLIFDPTHYVNWVRLTSSSVFIGLRHKSSDLLPSQVIHYEPYIERTRIFTIEEGATMGFIKDDNCHIVDITGQIRAFTGSSFKTYQYFPPFFRDEKIVKLPHRNGVIANKDIVSFLWEGQYPDPAGVWVLEDNNLYHKHSLVFDKESLNSLGAIEVSELGALYKEDELYLGASVSDGENDVLGVYSTTQAEDVSVDDEQRLQFTTSKLISPEINNVWQDVAIKYDPEGQSGDIVIKYRKEPAKITEGPGATAFNGEWATAGEFTCSDAEFVTNVTAEDIEVGDEVIIRKGTGAGLIAHIGAITGTTTKTVTLDDSLTTPSGKFTFSVEKWKKVNTSFRDDRFSHKASLKDNFLEDIQLKVVAKNYVLEEIQVLSEPDKTIRKR